MSFFEFIDRHWMWWGMVAYFCVAELAAAIKSLSSYKDDD